jgi:hypothetical protein
MVGGPFFSAETPYPPLNYDSLRTMLLCAYECDFGDNDIITIVLTGFTTKKNVAVLSVLNLVSEFVKCNRPIRRNHANDHASKYREQISRVETAPNPLWTKLAENEAILVIACNRRYEETFSP